MIVVRNVFQLKFGKAKEAIAFSKEARAINVKLGVQNSRLLTDLTGPFYTLVLENSFDSLTHLEQSMKQVMGNPEWQALYQKMVPFVESGYREIFTVVD